MYYGTKVSRTAAVASRYWVELTERDVSIGLKNAHTHRHTRMREQRMRGGFRGTAD